MNLVQYMYGCRSWICKIQNILFVANIRYRIFHLFESSDISILFYLITLGGRRGTTDEFATMPFHLDLFSAALVELAKSIPVHSLILSDITVPFLYNQIETTSLISSLLFVD